LLEKQGNRRPSATVFLLPTEGMIISTTRRATNRQRTSWDLQEHSATPKNVQI